MAEVGTKYCLAIGDCPASETYYIPIYNNPTVGGGWPAVYDFLFPGLATTDNPVGTAVYLCNINDPNFNYQNVIVRSICYTTETVNCVECDNDAFTVILDPESIQILYASEDTSISCPEINNLLVENCENPHETLTLDLEFGIYLGTTLKFADMPDKCWFAKQLVFDLPTAISPTILSVCQNCSECIPPIEVPFVRTEPKPDLNFSGITVTQQNINDTVRFANSYYSIFLQLQHGITGPQNNIDPDKFWIKKQLINLEMSKVADSCTIPVDPTPTVCDEPAQSEPLPVSESET